MWRIVEAVIFIWLGITVLLAWHFANVNQKREREQERREFAESQAAWEAYYRFLKGLNEDRH